MAHRSYFIYISYEYILKNLSGARLGTARPGTKSGVAPGTGALASSVQVADRPMTQQVSLNIF